MCACKAVVRTPKYLDGCVIDFSILDVISYITLVFLPYLTAKEGVTNAPYTAFNRKPTIESPIP